MFNCFTLSVHAIDIHATNAGIVGIIVEQVQEVHMGPDVVADRNDPVNDDTCPGSLARDLCEWPSATDPSGISGLCWMYD